jgi:hypothetical protein
MVFCKDCGVFHLTFGQFYLELTENELYHFGVFLHDLDPDFWENKYCDCSMRRKIPIPTQQVNLYLMLNRTELEELKNLVFYKERKGMHLINLEDVDYDFIIN